MAEKKEKTEQEYVIPLRGKFRHVARYKKTPKAVKTIKEFLARHMKIYDRDLNKIKLSKEVNEFLWARGIKNPPHKVKVKAVKKGEIVNVELVDIPNKIKFKKLREEKVEKEALAKVESKKTMMQKAKEQIQGGVKKKTSQDENKDNDEVKEEGENAQNKESVKNDEQEKKESVEKANEKLEKEMAKAEKHTAKPENKKAEIAKEKSNKQAK